MGKIREQTEKKVETCSKPCSPSDYYKGGKCDKEGCYQNEQKGLEPEAPTEPDLHNLHGVTCDLMVQLHNYLLREGKADLGLTLYNVEVIGKQLIHELKKLEAWTATKRR